jgi:hypothetical protein
MIQNVARVPPLGVGQNKSPTSPPLISPLPLDEPKKNLPSVSTNGPPISGSPDPAPPCELPVPNPLSLNEGSLVLSVIPLLMHLLLCLPSRYRIPRLLKSSPPWPFQSPMPPLWTLLQTPDQMSPSGRNRALAIPRSLLELLKEV